MRGRGLGGGRRGGGGGGRGTAWFLFVGFLRGGEVKSAEEVG